MMKIGFIGAGNIATAMISGLLKEPKAYQISVSDRTEAKVNKFKDKVHLATLNSQDVIKDSDYLVLAIKPDGYKTFMEENKDLLQDKIVISVGAGISSKFMKSLVKKYILTMPNTPALVGLGMSSLVNNETINETEYNNVKKAFLTMGEVMEIKEDELGLMIAMAGSSPAYVGVIIDAMTQYGVKHGLDAKKAWHIAAQVVNATSQMHLDSDQENARALVSAVCSPNGTSIQAVDYFDDNGLYDMFEQAMSRVEKRADEMMDEYDQQI